MRPLISTGRSLKYRDNEGYNSVKRKVLLASMRPKSMREKWRKLEAEAREIRRREADWEFIKSQPPRLRLALEFYVRTGDLYVASRIANLTIEEFNELRIKARIPNVA